MKILYISDNPLIPTGFSIVSRKLAEHFAKKHEVFFQGKNLFHIPLTIGGFQLLEGGHLNDGTSEQLTRMYIQNIKPDVIFTLQDARSIHYLPKVLEDLKYKGKWVFYYPLDMEYAAPWHLEYMTGKYRNGKFLRCPDVVVCISDFAYDMVKEWDIQEVKKIYHGCLGKDTQLIMNPNGIMNIKNIVENQIPEKVLAFDEKNNQFIYTKILDWQKIPLLDNFMLKITTTNKVIEITRDNPILTKTGWKEADDLKLGSYISGVDINTFKPNETADKSIRKKRMGISSENKRIKQTWEKIIKIERIIRPYVYDITTKTGNFIANGLLVHNCDTKVYKPREKDESIIKEMGLDKYKYVIGHVSNNQFRKMIYKTLFAFKEVKKKLKDVCLFMHTPLTSPNIGWPIPGITDAFRIKDVIVNKIANIAFKSGANETYMSKLYSTMDVHCLLTGGEGCGLTILESMACGKSNVTTHWTTGPELIGKDRGFTVKVKDMAVGFNVEYRAVADHKDAAKKLLILLKDESLREEMGKNAVKFIRRRYDWRVVLPKWSRLISSL